MATKLESLSTKLQSALDLANSLPDAITLDELTNPGSAATMLEGTEMLDAQGKKVTGTIENKTVRDVATEVVSDTYSVIIPAGHYKYPIEYPIGSAKDSSDLTVTSATVTVPAGYYPNDASKSVATTTPATPTISVNSSTGEITASVSQSSGYINVVGTKTATSQLPTQSATTITPTKSSQTAVAAGKYTTGAVTVNPIPDEYQDVSNVTATAARTAAGDVFVDADGVEQTGTLVTDKVYLTGMQDVSTTIPAFLSEANSKITVPNTSVFGNAGASQVLAGRTFTNAFELADVGTMPNNGTLSSTIDGLNTKSVSIPKGYTDGGTVALDSTIDDTADSQAAQIAEIKAMLEGKSVSGGGSAVETCTVTITGYSTSARAKTICYMAVDDSGNISVQTATNSAQSITIENVMCGSIVVAEFVEDGNLTTENAELLVDKYGFLSAYHLTAIAGENATITNSKPTGGSN